MNYYLLRHEYPDEGFIDGDVVFSPPLPGYYQIGAPLDTQGLSVAVRLDKLVKKLRVDFFLTTSGAFFASKELVDLLLSYRTDLRTVLVDTRYRNGAPTEKTYYLLHVDQRLDCFDYQNSQYAGKPLVLQRLARGDRSDSFLVKGVQSLAVDEGRSFGADFFFVKNVLLIDPVVSEELVLAMQERKLRVRADGV